MKRIQKSKRRSLGSKSTSPKGKADRLTLKEYRALAENSPDLIDRFDRDCRHLYANPAAARIHGKEVWQILGKTIRETGIPEPFCSQWEDRIHQVFESGHPLEIRDTFRGFCGIGYYESRCVPEFAPNGKVRSVLVFTRDIASREWVDESMRENQILLQKIIELSPMSMAIVGMDGTIEYINRKAIATFGFAHVEIPTMQEWCLKAYPHEGYRREVISRWMGNVQQALVERTEIKGDNYQVTCKDGSEKTMFIFGVPVASKVFVMFNDITNSVVLQRELEKSRDDLELKVKDRTARLQGLAEEVIRIEHRERMRIAHVLHEDLQQWLAAAKFRVSELYDHALMTPAQEAAGRVQQMLEKAIEVTRSLAVDLRPPVIHQQGLKMALQWLARDINRKFDLAVTVKVGPVFDRVEDEMGLFVFNAIRELLLNVAKHAGVKTAVVRLRAKGKSQFTVEVSDKGCGFDPHRNGIGHIGLFSIRERTDVFGGNMVISSIPDRGTSVEITMPLKSGK